MKEKALTDRIIDTINNTPGAKAIKMHGSPFMEKGTPDIFASRNIMWAIEVKQKGKKPRRLQQHRLKEWKNAGAVAICVDSYEQFKQMWEENGS